MVTAADAPASTETPAPRQETVVVSASKVDEALADAPATMTVISGETLETSPAQNYGDRLRGVPGVNVVQLSARDVNVTSRDATSTLANSQLGLLDGRSIYLDLFGIIVWDFVPVNVDDIQQIEVVRGPASAVWGANAMTGAVNIITKSPRDNKGIVATLSGGAFSRDAGASAGEGAGGSYGLSLSVSRAPSDKIAYRLSGRLFHSDAFARPAGTIPLDHHPSDPSIVTGGAAYPTYENSTTTQPKADLRVDHDVSKDVHLTYSAGIAATSGVLHTGIGPFDLKPGSLLGYVRTAFRKSNLRVSAFANLLDAHGPDQLLLNPRTQDFIQGSFKTQTYDLEAGDSRLFGQHHVFSVGGNVRRNVFDISIAPTAENRTEAGAYLQDEVFYGRFRFSLGARVDKFSVIDKAVFSPRVTVTMKPVHEQSLRVSFNRAFRSPSAINNSLFIETVQPIDLSPIAPLLPPPLRPAVAQPFPLIVDIVGNPDLREESLTAWEVAYNGSIDKGRTTWGAAYYINDRSDIINFVNVANNFHPYTAQNPPPGFPLPAPVLTSLGAAGIFLPQTVATYLNLGPTRSRGLELSLDHTFGAGVRVYGNYSYQTVPKPKAAPTPFPLGEIDSPPKNRVNVGVDVRRGRGFGTVWVNHTDKAFWTDVLTAAYHGATPGFTTLNGTLGLRVNKQLTASLKGLNLTNKAIQQHIFGDILKRSVTAELKAAF
jgi:outer membrane receptor protein involved in Fe transport